MKIRRILSVFLLAVLLTVSFTPAAAAAQAPEVNARAALLVDTEKDIVLYGKNEHERMYPASITKVMTALLVLEAVERGELSLDQNVTASQEAIDNMDPEGSSAGIEKGEVMSVKNLLYCALMVSANEACDVLAVELDGSIKAFVERMNQRAAELGCEDTHFANTNGLHHVDHYTTAWDIYLIAREAMKNETFMTICNTLAYDVPATNKNDSRELHTTNSLISNWRILGYLYDGAEGIKTGTTDEAGYCLLSSAVRSPAHADHARVQTLKSHLSAVQNGEALIGCALSPAVSDRVRYVSLCRESPEALAFVQFLRTEMAEEALSSSLIPIAEQPLSHSDPLTRQALALFQFSHTLPNAFAHTREELLSLCSDAFARCADPVETLLRLR